MSAPEPMGRNYVAEMRALIDAETADGSYASPVVAARIVAKLRTTDPDLLTGWLDANATAFVREAINARDRSTRGRARQQAGRSSFADAAKQGPSAMARFLDLSYVVNDKLDRKPLAQMRRPDLIFVAEGYERDALEAKFEAQWFRAIAKKVGAGTVADHFTEDQLAEMRASISGRTT